jgi:hypothetical protein
MKYRKLRIAWSVGCGIICLLLITLWVRSYWYYDFTKAGVTSAGGKLYVGSTGLTSTDGRMDGVFSHNSVLGLTVPSNNKVMVVPMGNGRSIPHYIPLAIASVIAVAPWTRQFRWRFSLRTLLIGMTMVAVVLGLIISLSR